MSNTNINVSSLLYHVIKLNSARRDGGERGGDRAASERCVGRFSSGPTEMLRRVPEAALEVKVHLCPCHSSLIAMDEKGSCCPLLAALWVLGPIIVQSWYPRGFSFLSLSLF